LASITVPTPLTVCVVSESELLLPVAPPAGAEAGAEVVGAGEPLDPLPDVGLDEHPAATPPASSTVAVATRTRVFMVAPKGSRDSCLR
jgi:hypothetical protein